MGLSEKLLTAALRTRRRLRLMAGLRVFSKGLPWAVLFLLPVAIGFRYALVQRSALVLCVVAATLALLGASFRAIWRGPGLLEAALRLDAAHGLRGRLTAGLEYLGCFGAPDRQADDGYVMVVVQQAQELGELSPKEAAPLSVPGRMSWGVGMLLFWLGLFFVPSQQQPPPTEPRPTATAPEDANWLMEDDAELLKAASAELEEQMQSTPAKDAAKRFNEIVLQAFAGEIDQAEAFRLAAELQADLDAAGREASELIEGLDKRGESLEKRSVTREIGRALRDRDYEEAQEALERLAERLSSKQQPLSDRQLEELRASIEEMRGQIETQTSSARDASATESDQERALRERQKRLLKKKNEGKLSSAEKKEFEQNQRRLKRLSRRKKSQQSAQKTLSELDKQLAEAARQLQKEREKSGEHMQQAARSLQEGVQKQLSDEEKRELIKQLKALKERLRRQNKEGKQAERLREFQKRARGQKGQQQDRAGSKQGGAPQPGGQIRLGPDGQPLPIPGQGQGQQQGERRTSGKDPGQGHDPNVAGESSHLDDASTQDTAAVAQDTGEGQSASETILSVAEEGFTSASYETLFREYETVAEEVMEKDSVPVGRKAHVQRYFELIRPREGGPRTQGKK